MALLADAAVLLRARALLERSVPRPLLAGLMPVQLSLELGATRPGQFYQQQSGILKVINEIMVRNFGFRNTLY